VVSLLSPHEGKSDLATKRDFLKMIRQFCSQCVGGSRATANIWPVPNSQDIKDCTAPECVWFKYRFGKDLEKRTLTPAQKAVLPKHGFGVCNNSVAE
jgi:hypothetical protein